MRKASSKWETVIFETAYYNTIEQSLSLIDPPALWAKPGTFHRGCS